MTVALLVIAAVVGLPILAVVLVSVASRREESAWSLRDPAKGLVQATARRIVDFHSEDPGWPLPKSCDQVRSAVPALRSASQPGQIVSAHSPSRPEASDVIIRPAA